MRTKGKITSWNDDKGFGFITPLAGGKQVFIHISAFSNRNRRPEVSEVVTYSLSTDDQGRPCAANATLAGDKLVKRAPGNRRKPLIVFAVLFVAVVGGSVSAGSTSIYVLFGYLGLSFITFITYALDKSAARAGDWRTSEGALLFLGLAGGWPGALIAQETLRHKTRKPSFRGAFWITVIMNCAALAWLHTDGGRQAIQNVLA